LLDIKEKWERDDSDGRFKMEVFTHRRYVSQSEIDMMLARAKSEQEDDWGVRILRHTGVYGDWDGRIFEPGFYRVDIPRDCDAPMSSCFHRCCADGMPLHHRNRFMQDYERERLEIARVRYDENCHRIWDAQTRKQRRAEFRAGAKGRRLKVQSGGVKSDAAAFFRTWAIAGAIKEVANDA